jgi:hypothetical protein
LLISLEAIATLHETPTEALRMQALKAIENATENLTSDISTDIAMPEAAHQLRRQALSILHFIHSALLDDESVLATKEKN